MAIKNTDYSCERHITYFSSGTIDDGQCVIAATGTYSGAALEHANRYAYVGSSASGAIPLGICETKVQNYDLTRQKLNPFNPNEAQTGSKISIIKHGWVNTNYISGTPTAGNPAYIHSGGYMSPTQLLGYAQVGRFLTAKDGNGFATVAIDSL